MSEPKDSLPLGVPPLVRPIRRFRGWFLAGFYFLSLLPMTVHPRQSANVLSRYLTIEAIVERGTLAIERTPMIRLTRPADMVRFGSHYYSDKPPVLSVLASPVYGALVLMNVRFTGSETEFVLDNLVLTWSIVGLASSLTLVWLRRLLQTVPIAPIWADLLTLGFGFGSQLLAYAVTFNNHSVAAALITGAMASTILEGPGDRAAWSRLFAGFLVALATTIDLPAGGIMLAGLGLLQVCRIRSIPWAFALGAIGPLLLHIWFQSRVTGSPWPVEMYPEAFEFPGSFWTTPEMVWQEHGPRWRFGVELLVGPRGWLTVTPVLVFGLIGLGLVLAKPGDPLRPMARVVAGSVVVLLVYYTWLVRRTDFGGDSFGTRHLLAITPACFFFAVVTLSRLRGKVVAPLFVLALALSGVYAVIGMKDPWQPIEERRKVDPWLANVQRLVIYPRSQNLEKPEAPR